MAYKLMAVDTDGTLLTNEKIISPQTVEAIEKGNEVGTTVVVWFDNKLYANKINERVHLNDIIPPK